MCKVLSKLSRGAAVAAIAKACRDKGVRLEGATEEQEEGEGKEGPGSGSDSGGDGAD